MIKIISRDQWGARAPAGRFSRMRAPEGVIVHHSAGAVRSVAAVASIQRAHQARGWVDVGYNFLIAEGGQIYEGRPEVDGFPVIGAHSPGQNSKRVGLCVLGDFRDSHHRPSPAQVAGLVSLCQWCAIRYQIRPLKISGHRDHRSTACPGDRLYRLIGTVRALAARPFVVQVEVG